MSILIEQEETQTIYEIRVKGYLEGSWSEWFDGLVITNQADGEMLLCGSLPDQSALFGVLIKIRDLGLPLLAVNRTNPSCQTFENRNVAGIETEIKSSDTLQPSNITNCIESCSSC